MLVNITEYFIESGREWQVGQNPDVPREVAARWIADGKATADTDGARNQSPVSGGGSALPSDVAWSTTWDTAGYKDLGSHSVSGALALVSSDVGSVVGGCTQAVVIANGSNVPTLDGTAATSYGYVNTSTTRNLVQLFRAGASKFWSCGAYAGAAVSAPATAVTMSGPSSGVVSVASTNFTIGANGVITGTIVVTPSDAANGGTFTPTTVSISSGTPTATFTYTPASTGAKTVSVANNGGLSNPSSITYTSNAAATAPGAPTGLTLGTATSTTQPLTWTAPASDGGSALTDYVIQWRTTTGPGSWNTFSDGTSTTAATTVTGLSAGTSYDYQVAAVNAVGQGSYSSTATGSTASVSYLRETSLSVATESGTGPYTYTGTGVNGCAGVPNLSLASSANGEIQATIKAMPSSFVGAGFATTDTAGIYSTFLYLLYANTNLTGSGTYRVGLSGAAGIAGNGADTATIPAADDIIRIARSGSAINFYVARAATPTTWLTIHTIASGGNTGLLYPRCIMNANTSAIEMTSYVGLS